MPCGKKPLVKLWDKSRTIKVVTPSVYEKNEASVRAHWINVIKDLEAAYKDENFWESQANQVKELVSPVVFDRLRKIFDLPQDELEYKLRSEIESIISTDNYYRAKTDEGVDTSKFSLTDYHFASSTSHVEEELEEELEEEEEEEIEITNTKVKSLKAGQRFSSKNLSKLRSKSFSRYLSKVRSLRSASSRSRGSFFRDINEGSLDGPTSTNDDVQVHVDMKKTGRVRANPHHRILYCCASETDMISWNSKYRTKTHEVSASDAFNKKAEILTKKIAKEFYEWWLSLGTVEFKSEIRRPEDIEDLFQVWFDEHASRGLVLDPRTLPCVLESVAKAVGVPKAACTSVLKRQVAYDVRAETSPEHTVAFGTCLPQRMKHIPPDNNTEQLWHSVRIPEDLKSMACVWEEISHLTSTKEFHKWLKRHPHQPMPPCLKALDAPGDKRQSFVVPSDYFIRDAGSSVSVQELQLPISQFAMELQDVLGELMAKS